jgi:signal transduction histidine kinase
VQGEHDKVFEPFERLGVDNHYGLGIGLSTVKRAVEGWGGRVWVESSPGEGSTFFFSVPLAAGS